MLDAEPPTASTSRARSSSSRPSTRVILVAGKRLSGDQMRAGRGQRLRRAVDRADDRRRAPRRGRDPARRAAPRHRGVRDRRRDRRQARSRPTVSNLSVDGVRIVVTEPVVEGQLVELTVTPEGEPPVTITRHRGVGAAARRQDRRRRSRSTSSTTPRAGGAREADAVAGRQGRRAHARRAARRLHRGDAVRRAVARDGRPRRVRHGAGHVHELARRARVVRVPSPGADPGLRVPRLLGAVHPPGVDGARRDRPRHGDLVLRAVPLHQLRSPGGAPAAVGGDPRVGPRAAGVQVPELRRARSSSTICPSATSRSSRTRRTSPMRRLFVRSFAIAFVGFALLFGVEFFLEWARAGYPGWSAGELGRASTTPSSSTSCRRWRARTTTCSRC